MFIPAEEPPAEGVPEPAAGLALALPAELPPEFAAPPPEFVLPSRPEFAEDIAVEPPGDPAGPAAEFPPEAGPEIAAKSDKPALETEFRFLGNPPPLPPATEFEMSSPETAGGTTCE